MDDVDPQRTNQPDGREQVAYPEPADRKLLHPDAKLFEALEENPVAGAGHHELKFLSGKVADEVVDLLGAPARAGSDEKLKDANRHGGMVQQNVNPCFRACSSL